MTPLRTLLFLAAIVASTSGHCYDQQVAADQFFDDSFVCKDKDLAVPRDLMQSDLDHLDNLDILYFLDTATSCFNESNFFSSSYTAMGDYAYQCICPSNRRRVEAVYMNKDVCFVVQPVKQDIQYAQCRGYCSFDYGTPIANDARGYFCAYNAFVQREFVVWCPLLPPQRRVQRAAVPGHRAGQYRPFGTFKRVTYKLPTLCSCRGYFCNNHAATAL
ncbi:hypothetical protein ACOMHN_060086 [Nucella lapillus]